MKIDRKTLMNIPLVTLFCKVNVKPASCCIQKIFTFSPKEFIECIGHIRLLSWLLLGSLTHTAMQGNGTGQTLSQPIPNEASCQIADHIQVIMAGFAEQPKASVLHMSSLFHTFILCQVCIYNNQVPTYAYNTFLH